MSRGGVSFVSQGDRSVVGAVLHDDQLANGYLRTVGPAPAPVCHAGDGYSAPTGGATDENVAVFGGAEVAYSMISAQTLLAPVPNFGTGFLDAGLDQGAAEGVEYLFGRGLVAGNPMSLLTGGPGLGKVIRCKIAFSAVADVADGFVGFRGVEPFDSLGNYVDTAGLDLQAGVINHAKRKGSSGSPLGFVDTGETMVDDVVRELEVRVSVQGRVTTLVDGVQVGPLFDFDPATVVVPIIHFLQGGGASGMSWAELEVGSLWHVRKDPFIQRA